MNLTYGLDLRQKQDLVMTVELSQAIKILEYNNLELLDFLRLQAEKNPLIDLVEDSVGYRESLFEDNIFANKEFIPSLEGDSLRDKLYFQLNLLVLDGNHKNICKYIIENIDKDGYLDEEKISPKLRKSLDYKYALKLIQKMDPLGVGARSLEESLLIQLREAKKLNPINKALVENSLDLIALKLIDKICHIHKITSQEARDNIELIKSLNPYPGRTYQIEDRQVNYIYPDISIRKENDNLKIFLKDKYLPEIKINRTYLNMLKEEEDEDVLRYLTSQLKSALWIQESIEKRRNTILKVSRSLIEFQHAFFYNNIDDIKPLKLKDLSKDIDMHESTISRVCRNKYIECEMGTYPLSYFFNSAIDSTEGKISSLNIKKYLLDIIAGEDKESPYSDLDLAHILYKKFGVKISRRTVTKYRSQLDIASSYMRRIK